MSVLKEENNYVPVKNYEDLYKINREGDIISLVSNNKIKVCMTGSRKYPFVNLRKDKKCTLYFVHRLVAETFVQIPERYTDQKVEVNHIDSNKENFHVDNLEWVTHAENMKYISAQTAEKNCKKVQRLTKDGGIFIEEYKSIKEASEKTGIYDKSIGRCCNKKPNCISAGGFKWKYADNNMTDKNQTNYIPKKGEKFIELGVICNVDLTGYSISNYGTLINRHKYKMKTQLNGSYEGTSIRKKFLKIHRLVALTFIPNYDKSKKVINHIDENKLNNRADNLEWMTSKENSQYSMGKSVDMYDKDNNFLQSFHSIGDACRYLGGPENRRISSCCEEKVSVAHGYIWRWSE